jgi:hypothetical protein
LDIYCIGSRVSIQRIFLKFILSCQQFYNCSHCLPPVSYGKFAAGVVDTSGKFAASIIVSTTLAKMVEKFAPGVVDTDGKFVTGGKFAASVVDTGGKFSTCIVDTGGAP